MHEVFGPGISWALNQGALGIIALLCLGFGLKMWKRADAKDEQIAALNNLRVEEMKLALKTVNDNTNTLEEARNDYERIRNRIDPSEAA